MTLANGSQNSTGGQEPGAAPCGSGQGSVDHNQSPSAQSPIAARVPMSADVAVMFLLLMRQMDRLRESSGDSIRKNDHADQAASRVD